MMQLSLDFNAFIDVCKRHGVRFLIVGGYAVAAHGHARMTKDLDVFVEATDENADTLMAALTEFGFGGIGLKAADFTEPGAVIQLGSPPVRIDLLTSIDAVSFDEAYDQHVEIEVDGRSVPFIGREQLITNKEATGRLQDLADVERLRSDDAG
jgi:predicted nucleotidyltransferase